MVIPPEYTKWTSCWSSAIFMGVVHEGLKLDVRHCIGVYLYHYVESQRNLLFRSKLCELIVHRGDQSLILRSTWYMKVIPWFNLRHGFFYIFSLFLWLFWNWHGDTNAVPYFVSHLFHVMVR